MLAARVCSVCIRSNSCTVTYTKQTQTHTHNHDAGIKRNDNTTACKLKNTIRCDDYPQLLTFNYQL